MRLIDADALLERHDAYYDRYECLVLRYAIEKAPTVDAVPVVRCGECGHCEAGRKRNGEVYFYRCGFFDIEIEPQDFCSSGERRDSDG